VLPEWHETAGPEYSPPLEEGWLRDKKSCEATFDAQTGWSKTFLTTPSAPTKDAFGDILLEVASTPPLEEGNRSRFSTLPRGQRA
jgi:hypothetical protein